MPALTTEEKLRQKTLYEIGYNYLASNFSKFKTKDKIKVALDVISIFNKDGSKTQGGNLIFVINSDDSGKSIPTNKNTIEILPASKPEVNQRIEGKV